MGAGPLGEPGGVTPLMPALVQLAQRAPGPGQEHGAEPVELNSPSAAVEERHAEFGFQPRD